MKLRQKLAMVLASAMIVTAVPVVTMAASTNGYNQTITVAKNDILDSATGLALELKVDANDTGLVSGKTFYVKATDFKFINAAGRLNDSHFTIDGKTDNVVVTVSSDTELSVQITGALTDNKVILPIVGKVTGETPTITVDGEGTILSSGKYPIMGADQVATDKKITAKVGDATNISVDGVGKIANVTIEEVTKGRLDNQEVTIELDTAELAFDTAMLTGTADANGFRTLDPAYYGGQRGLAAAGQIVGVKAKINEEEITLKFDTAANADRGSIVLKGLAVKSNTRGDVSTGDVEATITATGDKVMDKVEAKVATVAEYDVNLTVKDDKAVEFVAGGKEQEVTFKLKELAAGTLTGRHDVYFTVEGAKIVSIQGRTVDNFVNGDNTATPVVTPGKNYGEVDKNNDGDKEDAGEFTTLTYDKDDKEFTLDLTNVDQSKVSEYEVTLKLAAAPDSTEDIVVKATSKAFDDKEVVVGTVKTDKEIEVAPVNLVVGTKGQKGGSVVITEDEEKVFGKNEVLFVSLEEDAIRDGLRIKDFDVEADGLEVEEVDAYYVMKVETTKAKDGTLLHDVVASDELTTEKTTKIDDTNTSYDGRTFKNVKATNVAAVQVAKQSKEAGSITLENFVIDTTNGTPDGSYKVTLSGSLISKHGDSVEKDFVVVGEGAANKQAKVELVIGDATYTVDGKEKEAEVAPFIDPATDRTMAPVRAVAEAFGCELDFYFPAGSDQLVITMTRGNDRVQFQNGSNIMVANGGQYIMSATAQIKDGYTFVPVAFLAQALNIEYEWFPETQTIVFGNK